MAELILLVELSFSFVNGIVTFNASLQFIPAVGYIFFGLSVGPGLLEGF